MKLLIIFAVIVACCRSQQLYDSNNDNLDIEALVADQQRMRAFMGCFLDTAACDEVAADFKKDLPEATTNACAKCTQAQKHILKRFLEVSKTQLPDQYDALKVKLDPENKYFTALETAIVNA